MSTQNSHLTRILANILNTIEKEFDKIGLFYRIFSRVKSNGSLQKKLLSDPNKYQIHDGGKKIQDVLGLRITLYFNDDIDLAISILKKLFRWNEGASNIAPSSKNQFEAKNCNLIFSIPDTVCIGKYLDDQGYCDNTFEVQIRTVFSEGWHEVEHDLRYKHPDDWKSFDNATRTLNGFLASLETIDWGVLQLLDDLTFRHYKNKNWEAMLRNKLRIRVSTASHTIDSNVLDLLNDHTNGLGKSFFKLNRHKVIESIYERKISLPLNLNNLIYIINEIEIQNLELSKITPSLIKSKINDE